MESPTLVATMAFPPSALVRVFNVLPSNSGSSNNSAVLNTTSSRDVGDVDGPCEVVVVGAWLSEGAADASTTRTISNVVIVVFAFAALTSSMTTGALFDDVTTLATVIVATITTDVTNANSARVRDCFHQGRRGSISSCELVAAASPGATTSTGGGMMRSVSDAFVFEFTSGVDSSTLGTSSPPAFGSVVSDTSSILVTGVRYGRGGTLGETVSSMPSISSGSDDDAMSTSEIASPTFPPSVVVVANSSSVPCGAFSGLVAEASSAAGEMSCLEGR
mmetsp:Transcript_4641/g.9048  ORF Transcript_4641/g.9048 Transcript_4641/m.9048 type:complete len:276 (-) Transcript_4641:695-1522(-)